jgi:hypothetical protein
MKLHTLLYRAARGANDVDAVRHPSRLPRRVRNKIVGRLLGRAGVWGRLWR